MRVPRSRGCNCLMRVVRRSLSGGAAPPLQGLRVLDCGNFLAGPLVSLHMAALGAEVIKVEKPRGDDSRAVGPFTKQGAESSYFLSINRGKRSIAMDTRTPSGAALFRRLAATADVLVENYRPGVMDRLGIGYDVLAQDNPRLVYASVSGFGQTGADAERPSFDSLIQAAGGLISVTGPEDDDSSSRVRVGVSIVDICSGMHLLIATMAALHARHATGRGQRVDASMLATASTIMESPIARHSVSGEIPNAQGLAHPVVAPFDGFRTQDGVIYIATSNDARAHICMRELGLDALVTDERFASNTARMAHRAELGAAIEAKLAARTTDEWERRLVPRGVPCSAINDVAQMKARFPEVFVTVEHPVTGALEMSGAPFTFSDSSVDYAIPAPTLGQHTDDVLREIGVSSDEIAQLRADGIVV